MRDSGYKYVYCIANSGCLKGLKIKGVSGRRAYEIRFKDLCAVASDTKRFECEASEKNLQAHKMVLGALLENTTMVPMSFGMVFANEQVLAGALGEAYGDIKRSLELLEGKVELGVKVIAQNGENGSSSMMASEIKNRVVGVLAGKSASLVEGKLFSDRLLANLSFLVEKNRVQGFSDAVESLEKEFPQFKFNYTGPWPPYNFVTMKIGG